MKTIALATAFVAVLSAPAAFASDNLALSLGVEPGAYTTSELIRLENAMEGNDAQQVAFILNHEGNPVAASDIYQAQLRQASEDDNHAYVSYLLNGGTEVISTQSYGPNEVAQRIFAELAAE